jgi:hypothetical protein
MDKLTRYRDLIKRYLSDLAALVNRDPKAGVETSCVFDEDRGHYLLINTGWARGRRIRGATLYVRLKNGKVWIEEDWTEEGIGNFLVEAGVPKEDIVLAFQAPEMRALTDFAVA